MKCERGLLGLSTEVQGLGLQSFFSPNGQANSGYRVNTVLLKMSKKMIECSLFL